MTSALIMSLIQRQVADRYRGSFFGLFWALLTPLFLLAVYTFAFGLVFQVRWPSTSADAPQSTALFALVLFSGLIAFQFVSEVIGSAPSLILSNRNYVKKIVFPLQILPVVAVGAALFQAAVSLIVLAAFDWLVLGAVPWTIILAPLMFVPLVVMVLGMAWFLAAVGVYFRDIGQLVPPLLTTMMFFSPLFFPRTALPDWLQPYLSLTPLTIPVEAFRAVSVFGQMPDWTALGYYSLAAIVVAILGEQFFRLTRRGFADVL